MGTPLETQRRDARVSSQINLSFVFSYFRKQDFWRKKRQRAMKLNQLVNPQIGAHLQVGKRLRVHCRLLRCDAPQEAPEHGGT